MKKGKLTLNIKPIFLIEQTDLSNCIHCEDVIYGDLYRLWLMPSNKDINLIGHKTEIILCKSCCELSNIN